MNSFILDSDEKHYKNKIILLFLIALIIYLFFNLLSIRYDQYLRKKEEKAFIFRGDVHGKFALMKKFFSFQKHPDIIFIGNSITILHVNTNFFYEKGIMSFNYATTGYFIGQFPKMIENAIKLKPKNIAISLFVNDFYQPSSYYFDHYDHDNDVNWRDLYFLATHISDRSGIKLLIDFTSRYLINLSFFTANGYAIRRGIKERYERVQHGSKLKHMIFPYYHRRKIDYVSTPCDFDTQGHRVHESCMNSDAVMIGQAMKIKDLPYREKINLLREDYNLNLVALLNGFFDEIRQAGIKPTLILVPSFKEYLVDKSLLQQTIRAEIIDMSDMPFAKSYFADATHFNMQGREVYSKKLIENLKIIK